MHYVLKAFMALGYLVLFCSVFTVQAQQWPLDKTDTQAWVSNSPKFVEGVQQAYKHHQVVAIGDYHWNNKVMLNINQLIQTPNFLSEVKQLVVEFGNARYQSELDRYLSGQTQDDSILKLLRRNALFFTAWMPEVYADFFRIVRAYNMRVDKDQKVKVWLAESPVYWEDIQSQAQWQALADNKTTGFYQTVQQAIYTQDKVLMVFGAFHLLKIKAAQNAANLPLATLLNHTYPQQIYTIWPITDAPVNAALVGLAIPSLLKTNVAQGKHLKLTDVMPKAKVRLARLGQQDASVAEVVDALLYVGNSKLIQKFPASTMHDKAWLNEMNRRLNLVGGRALAAFQVILANSQADLP